MNWIDGLMLSIVRQAKDRAEEEGRDLIEVLDEIKINHIITVNELMADKYCLPREGQKNVVTGEALLGHLENLEAANMREE